MKLALAHDARRLGDEEREQIERLRCQVQLAPFAVCELPPI